MIHAPRHRFCVPCACRRRVDRPAYAAAELLEERALLSASAISIQDATVTEPGSIGVLVAAGSGGLSVPKDLTLGPDGSLFVVSSATNSVLRYNASTGSF